MAPKAPPLTGTWLNSKPVEWRSWRGNVGIVVFWSIGCEASLAFLQRVQMLKAERCSDLCVFAVHSPRTSDELDIDNVRAAIQRHRITVPVVHDEAKDNWARYNPPGWPSAIVVNRKQRAAGLVFGASEIGLLHDAVALEQSRTFRGEIPPTPRAAQPQPPTAVIGYPAGLAALGRNQLVVSDVAHHRIAVIELDESDEGSDANGRIVGVIDTRSAPGPLCVIDQSTIAVSFPDAGDVVAYQLPILNGQPSGRTVIATGLVRPQGLALDHDGSLLIADAGADVLIRVATDGVTGRVAGSGITGCTDGKGAAAELAQPTGLVRTNAGVAFVDTATSTLRLLTDDGAVRTTTGASVSHPGLVDGPLHSASLLHPRAAVALDDNRLLIVDTGNNRLRLVADRKILTVGLAGLRRPEAACLLSDGRVIVADTGNHRLAEVNLDTKQVRAISIDPQDEVVDRFHITAAAQSTLAVGFPVPTSGPWRVTVTAQPPSLLRSPLTVVRNEPGAISITLGEPGEGSIIVSSRSQNDEDVLAHERISLKVC